MLAHVQDALWLFEVPLFISIVILMWRSGFYRRMPLFFSYAIVHGIYLTVAYMVFHWGSYKFYFYFYWSMTSLLHILEFAIIYELFGALFRQREGLKDFGTMLFRWAMLVMLLMGLILVASSNGLKTPQFMNIVMSMESSIELIMVGLVLFLMAFAKHLGISGRHKVFGIILGWGLFSAVELLLHTEHGRIGLPDTVLSLIHMGAVDAMLVIWLCYAVMPEPAEVLPNMLLRSQRWNEALLDQPHAEGEPTLLLGIENLVERAMTTNNIIRHPKDR
jgi:hypothetical protein